MPNWSYNTLTIKGKKEDVENVFQTKEWSWKKCKTLKEFIFGYEFTMRSWMPMPKTFVEWDTTNALRPRDDKDWKTGLPKFNSDAEYKRYCDGYKRAKEYQKKKYGAVGWYDYNCQTLGCKWDCTLRPNDFVEYEDGTIEVTFEFDTPWSAPMTWFEWMYSNHSKDLEWSIECHEESDMFNFIGHWNSEDGYYEEECGSLWEEDDEEDCDA